ncbi:MAG: folylpolyglutamate synthase/dihydrofolate synthase family protein [Nitrospirota bacterium]
MSYRETVQYLYNLRKFGIKFGLENITRLATLLGNPHESFRSVHVAGTNGKGSTSAMIASVLRAAGFRVGLFTSPHLVSFTERIRIDGEEITEAEVVNLAGEVKSIVGEQKDFSPTFFEVVAAMAMLYFSRKRVDVAVFETGMGGRLDATNIVHPLVSVITSISYDHKEFLGTSLGEIAHEKAGIIKSRTPVVSSRQEPAAEAVIKDKAREESADIFFYGRDFSSVLKGEDIKGIEFDYSGTFSLNDVFVPLTGEHQMENASVAISAAMLCLKRLARSEGEAERHIRLGLGGVRWPGRLQMIDGSPPILLDGAHNPAAALSLARSLKKTFLKKYPRIIIILGVMSDKEIRGIMEPLLSLSSEVILASPSCSRAAPPEMLLQIAASLGHSGMIAASSVEQAIALAGSLAASGGDDSLILITGSFYTLGEAQEVLGHRGIFAGLRE